MYMSVKDLRHVPIRGTDGRVGFLEQVFFDDTQWVIRYLVVDTDPSIGDRRVLLSPIAVDTFDLSSGSLLVRLDGSQVRQSPDIDTEKPVSRRKELEYNRFYGHARYWGGPGLWGGAMVPGALFTIPAGEVSLVEDEAGDPHLRSSREVLGYRIRARDGRIGHVEDLIFDLGDWSICFLELDTRNWIGGMHVLVDPRRVEEVNWEDRTVRLGLTVESIRTAPPFESLAGVTPDYVMRLDAHYGQRQAR